MGLIKVENTPAVPKKVTPLFGTACDLAKSISSAWCQTNLDLCYDADEVINFLRNEIANSEARNKFKQFFFERAIAKHKKTLYKLQEQLQFLQNEVEAFIGFNAYLKAGVKSKIRNKKIFDDALIEAREITAMLIGIASLLDKSPNHKLDYDFKHELEIIEQISKNKSTRLTTGYYSELLMTVGVHTFE